MRGVNLGSGGFIKYLDRAVGEVGAQQVDMAEVGSREVDVVQI